MLFISLFILKFTGLFESQDFLSAFQSRVWNGRHEQKGLISHLHETQNLPEVQSTDEIQKKKKYPLFYDGKSCLFPSYLNILFPKLLGSVRQMDERFWNQSSGHRVFSPRLASVRITLRVAGGTGGSSLPPTAPLLRQGWALFSQLSLDGLSGDNSLQQDTRAPTAPSSGQPRAVNDSRCRAGNKSRLYSSASSPWYFPHPPFPAPSDKGRILRRRRSSRKSLFVILSHKKTPILPKNSRNYVLSLKTWN